MKISCARPLLYLFTEPIVSALKGSLRASLIPNLNVNQVMAISIWIGFAWVSPLEILRRAYLIPNHDVNQGMVFLFVGAVSHVFRVTYGFSQGQGGTVLICGFIGAVFAWFETI